MFLQNKHGEIVNTEAILAVKIFDDKAPYQIHVFTEKTETIFEFDSQESVIEATERMMRRLRRECFRWAECKNWKFRSDKILSINESTYRDLKVSMVDRDFNVYFDIKDKGEELEAAKDQITKTLSEKLMPDSPDFMERFE